MQLASPALIHVVEMKEPSTTSSRDANIYVTPNGWMYEVWFQGRVVVVGCCATFEAAMRAVATV
jgi:hypothetical protein